MIGYITRPRHVRRAIKLFDSNARGEPVARINRRLRWRPGAWKTVQRPNNNWQRGLCHEGWFHCYPSEEIAYEQDYYDAHYARHPGLQVWEIEVLLEGEPDVDYIWPDDKKCGVRTLRLIKRLPTRRRRFYEPTLPVSR